MGRTLNLTHVFFKLIIPRNIVEQEEPGFLFCSTGVTLMILKAIIIILVWDNGGASTTTDIVKPSQGRELQVDRLSFRKRGVYKRRFSCF